MLKSHGIPCSFGKDDPWILKMNPVIHNSKYRQGSEPRLSCRDPEGSLITNENRSNSVDGFESRCVNGENRSVGIVLLVQVVICIAEVF